MNPPSYGSPSSGKKSGFCRSSHRVGTACPIRIGVALTWDGSPWPTHKLPAPARQFLSGTLSGGARRIKEKSRGAATREEKFPGDFGGVLSQFLAAGAVSEVRVCWVPYLQGARRTWVLPFLTPDGTRLAFRADLQFTFQGIAAVIYSPLRPVRSPLIFLSRKRLISRKRPTSPT